MNDNEDTLKDVIISVRDYLKELKKKIFLIFFFLFFLNNRIFLFLSKHDNILEQFLLL